MTAPQNLFDLLGERWLGEIDFISISRSIYGDLVLGLFTGDQDTDRPSAKLTPAEGLGG